MIDLFKAQLYLTSTFKVCVCVCLQVVFNADEASVTVKEVTSHSNKHG